MPNSKKAASLSHLRADGRVRMVNVGEKSRTLRVATAEAVVRMNAAALSALSRGTSKKGDALAAAEIAGIMAAKRAPELIPLCHPLALTHVDVRCALTKSGVQVRCSASTVGQTGVEIEALVGAGIAALTIYDMCKSLDRAMAVGDLRLLQKSGGQSGAYRRRID